MANLTLFDLATLRRNDEYTGLIEDVTTLAPEFTSITAVPRSGTSYEIVRRTGLPTTGFRTINAGVVPSKSSFKKETKEMFYLDTAINMDEAIVKADDSSVGAVWQLEAAGAMRSASILLGAQTWYGTSTDANGFAGIRSQLAGNIGAGGSTSSTSAYLLWMDPKEGVRFDVGRDGQFAISSPVRQQVADPNDSTKNLFMWVGNLSAFVGLTVGSAYSTWAITGIDTTEVSSVYTRALNDRRAAQLVGNIPVARRNNLKWFINRTSQLTLEASRSSLGYQPAGADGAAAWAPSPTKLAGYPIVLTDSITDTESN